MTYFDRLRGINSRFDIVVTRRFDELPWWRRSAFRRAVHAALDAAEAQYDLPFAGALLPMGWNR